MLVGLPGSGKTTLSKIIEGLTGAERISSDETRLKLFEKPNFSQKEHDELYALIDHNVEHLLSSGRSVVYDANLNRLVHRKEKYELAKKYDAKTILWRLTTLDELSKKRRIKEQNHRLLPEGETAEKMFERIASIYEPPKNTEKHVVINGLDINKNAVKEIIAKLTKA